MKYRNPLAVAIFTLLTFGLYGIYWQFSTTAELNKRRADVPTALLIFIPIVNLWWTYKYCLGVEKVTKNKMPAALALVVLLLLNIVGMAIVQDSFNKVK